MANPATQLAEMNEMNAGSKPIRIAILDDDEEDFLIIEDYLRSIPGKEFKVDWFGTYEEAFEQVRNCNYDLYFVDYFLGNKTGLDLLREASSLDFDKPIVLLTGFGNRAIDISAMENGATDYLAKTEINAEKLERCIRYSLDRAQIMEKLKNREARYRNLFEKSRDGVFIADMELMISEANPATRKLLNLPVHEIGKGLIPMYDHIEDGVEKNRIITLLRNEQDIDDLEIKINKGEEENRNCLLSLRVQNNEEGEKIVHGILRDITSSKKAQYTSLQIEKVEANERLMRMLTHEIRNPLNNIILSCDQLLSNVPEENKKDFISIIQRNSVRINHIITELLNLSMPSDIVLEKEDLGKILKQATRDLEEKMKNKNIACELVLPEASLSITGDSQKLLIAISNIIQNSIDAILGDNGKIKLAIHCTDDHYTLSIRDNGAGIPAEYIARVFDPFFTLKKNGVGLGLTAAYSILKSHKASVHVESKERDGTLFMLSFER